MVIRKVMIVICNSIHVRSITEEYATKFQADGLATILNQGCTPKTKDGFILIGWLIPSVPVSFLARVRNDGDIIDYVVFDPPQEVYEQVTKHCEREV